MIGLMGVEAEIGVRDGGGLGGGNGWSIGVPYWRGWFRKLWKAAEGADEETDDTDRDEDGGAKNVEGFKRLVTWLPPLILSEESCRKAGKDEAEWGAEGIFIAGAWENTPLGATAVTVAEW